MNEQRLEAFVFTVYPKNAINLNHVGALSDLTDLQLLQNLFSCHLDDRFVTLAVLPWGGIKHDPYCLPIW
jgi:hypothetical protein